MTDALAIQHQRTWLNLFQLHFLLLHVKQQMYHLMHILKKKNLEIIFFLLPVFKMTATDLFSSQLSQPQVPERARLTLLKGNKTVQKQKKKKNHAKGAKDCTTMRNALKI